MNDSRTVLQPPLLNIARALWLVAVGLCVWIAIAGTVNFFNSPPPDCVSGEAAPGACGPWVLTRQDLALAQTLGTPVNIILALIAFQSIFPKLFFVLVGLIIFWRKSNDWVALLLSFMLIGFVVEGVTEAGALTPVAQVLYAVITYVFSLLPFIFPNGRFVPPWIKWIGLIVSALGVLAVYLPNLGIPSTDQIYILSLTGTFALWGIVAGYSAIYRYARVSNALEKQQTKWVVAGILGTTLLFIPFTIVGIWFPPSQPSSGRLAFYFFFFVPFYYVAYLFMPIAIAVAILRYRLWDIDILIRRTLTYALVTALLLVVFFGSVILLQQLFASITGAGQNELVTVLSTLAIAALFVPLRNRVQDTIDRRFNRKKYDAQQVLTEFAKTVRDETDLEKLGARLVQVVDETMQPKSVSVWLKRDEMRKRETRQG